MLAIKIIIADRQPMFAEGLSIILSSVENIQVITTVTKSSDVLETLKHMFCQVIILDLPVPLEDDLMIIRQIKKQYPKTHVLIFANNYEPQVISSVMLAGASGFALKNTKKEELIQAIIKVANGEIFLGESVTHSLAEYYDTFKNLFLSKY
jgi:two-component system, NarL family, nitrate/nitrite response regulator NarL